VAAEETGILAVIAAAAGAVGTKLLSVWQEARKGDSDTKRIRQEFVVSLLSQERARFDALLGEDRDEARKLRDRVSVLEAQVILLTAERDELRDDLGARLEQVTEMARRLRIYERRQPSDGEGGQRGY
jgi:hypothetical protein